MGARRSSRSTLASGTLPSRRHARPSESRDSLLLGASPVRALNSWPRLAASTRSKLLLVCKKVHRYPVSYGIRGAQFLRVDPPLVNVYPDWSWAFTLSGASIPRGVLWVPSSLQLRMV